MQCPEVVYRSTMSRQLTLTKSIFIGIGVVTLALLLMLFLDIDKQILDTLQWLDSRGSWALFWFVLIIALVVILVLPGVLFTTGAGFVFGITKGTVGVVIGTTLGACIAFLIARYLFSNRLKPMMSANNQLGLINRNISSQGFKIVLLTRLIPFFPGKLSNYLFGLTQMPLREFAFASLLGFVPLSLHNAYLGSLAADIATLGNRHTERTALEWALYGLGFLITVTIVLYLHRWANRTLTEHTNHQSTANGEP